MSDMLDGLYQVRDQLQVLTRTVRDLIDGLEDEAEKQPEVRVLRVKVFRYGLHFKPMLYREEFINTGGLPGRVRVGPFMFAGRAEVHVQDCMSISTGFNAGEAVRFDEDDAGEWSAWTVPW